MIYDLVQKKRILQGDHIKKILVRCGLIVLVLCTSAGLFLADIIPGRSELKASLAAILTEAPAVKEKAQKEIISSDMVIYVLGGSHKNMEERFKAVAMLCNKGSCSRILLFSEPGITKYDPSLGRNPTNDEWAIKELTGLGVKREILEPVAFKNGLFGTLTEAAGLADIAAQRNYKHVILVTSQYHTKRTWITFSRIFEKQNIALSIYAANDSDRLRSLLYEYVKLVLYKDIILPNFTKRNSTTTSNAVRTEILHKPLLRTVILPVMSQARRHHGDPFQYE